MQTTTPALSADQLSGIVDIVTTNFQAAIPYGLAILGVFLGLSVLKRILFSFM